MDLRRRTRTPSVLLAAVLGLSAFAPLARAQSPGPGSSAGVGPSPGPTAEASLEPSTGSWQNLTGTSKQATGTASTGDQPAKVFAIDTGKKVTDCSSPQGQCVVGQPDGPKSFEIFADPATTVVSFKVRTTAPIPCGAGLAFKASFDGATYEDQPALPSDNACNAPPPVAACPVKDISGYFEPTQAVWQDDPIVAKPHFADKPASGSRSGKRLVQLTPNSFRAELPMVTGKPTLLFGIDHTQTSAPEDLDTIVIRGVTTGTTPVKVAMLFSGKGAGLQLVYATHILGSIDLDGPCGAEHEFEIRLPAFNGVPLLPDPAFVFRDTGPYTLTDELAREDGDATGIEVTVSGTVVKTRMPTVAFVPMRLGDGTATPEAAAALQSASDKLARDSATYIPDFFPLRPGGLPVVASPIIDARAKIKDALTSWTTWVKSKIGVTDPYHVAEDALLASLANSASLGGTLGKQGRTVIVFDGGDYALVSALRSDVTFAGLAISQKVVLVGGRYSYWVAAHELVHTMPYQFADERMQQYCDFSYHNLPVDVGLAHGTEVTRAGAEVRYSARARNSFMGPYLDLWIDQCTYWQLINVLQDPPDPHVVVVRGVLARNGSQVAGQLLPAYQTDGAVDLTAGDGGDWAIVARSATGAVLGRYPFQPAWSIPDLGRERDLLSFLYRIPARGGVARVDLEGPDGQLDELDWSAHAPRVTITTPGDDTVAEPVDGTVHVTWTGSDADGDPLLYTVLTSDDGGKVFVAQSVEQTGTSFDVAVPPGGSQVIEVVATDGTRSTSSTVAVSTESTAAFVDGLVAAFRAGAAATYVDRLDPAVIKRYGANQCESFLGSLHQPTLAYTIRSQDGPTSWKYASDGRTTRILSTYVLAVDRTEDGVTTPITMHLGVRSGRLTFFSDCGRAR